MSEHTISAGIAPGPYEKHAEVAHGLRFPEGPVALRDGSVLVVEIEQGCLTRVYPNGEQARVAQTGGGPNGAAVGPDGAIYICNNGGFQWIREPGLLRPSGQPPGYQGGSIQRVDLQTGKVDTLYTECRGHKLHGPNDWVFDKFGGFDFTCIGKSRERDHDRGG